MNSLLPWLVIACPASLALCGMITAAAANADPLAMARRALVGAAVALTVAVATFITVIASGPLSTPTLGASGVGLSIYVDMLSAVMLVLVSFIGVVVVRFSRNYMDGDPAHGRFIKWLVLTLSAVLLLVMTGNLVFFIAAWIGTSLALGKLLLFYSERPYAVLAARKKFIASRIGDVCLVTAAVLIFSTFGTLDFPSLFARAKEMAVSGGSVSPAVTATALLIVVAALLKSAQLPMHGWLIEVMETPTPVSALLHAGIINAGGFLVLRLSDIVSLSGTALETLVIVGGATALFASVVLLTQTSVKVALAWSTVAQMGFMLLQCGLGAFSAALLHIVAHSLYKAHAFLSSGSVIDLARASWSPSPGGQPHPARLVLALLVVLAITIGVAALFGATILDKPGAVALGAILAMGLVHLIANAIDERPNSFVIGRVLGLAVLVAATYFALQAGAERLLASSLPATIPVRGFFDLVLVGLVILSFGAVTVFQSLAIRKATTPFWQAAHVHLSHGLYLNAVTNRLVLRYWPGRSTAAPSL